MTKWIEGDRVIVGFDSAGGPVDLPGMVARIQEPGPKTREATIKVIFDDPLVFGGLGFGWFRPENLRHEYKPGG